MSCPVVCDLAAAVSAVAALPVPVGLGADAALTGQVSGLADAAARLHLELALRMAALERAGARVADVRGEAVRAGLPESLAAALRRAGLFRDNPEPSPHRKPPPTRGGAPARPNTG